MKSVRVWIVLAAVWTVGTAGNALAQETLKGKWALKGYACKSGKTPLRSTEGLTDSLEIDGDLCTFEAKLESGSERCHVKTLAQCAENTHLLFVQLGPTETEGCKEAMNAEGTLIVARYEVSADAHQLLLAPQGSSGKSLARGICGDEADEAHQIYERR